MDAPIKAKLVSGFGECNEPGEFFLTEPNAAEGGARRLSFRCPCGCGDLCGIRINDDGSQNNYAWAWDQNKTEPTVSPSIDIDHGHWHGYLKKGIFESC